MTERIRWGILGTGGIAVKFAKGLSVLPDAELAAVGSRAPETAKAFGDRFRIPRRHGSYEALAHDPEIDVIYVATPHPMHKENSILCLKAGKAVLCEKPLTMNAREAEEVISVAREFRRFFMEAMWTRYLPAVKKVREWLAEGRIGEPRWVAAEFGFRLSRPPESRWLNPDLGGGALLDVGVYCISFASMVFQSEPERIVSMTHIGDTHVDEQSAMTLGYKGGRIAQLSCAVQTTMHNAALIYGTDGKISLSPWFFQTRRATLETKDDKETGEPPFKKNGYNYEAAEVMRCLRAGELESPGMPLDESLSIMRTMDRIREQWGLKYPME